MDVLVEQYLGSNEPSLYIQNTELLNCYQKAKHVSLLREDSRRKDSYHLGNFLLLPPPTLGYSKGNL